MGWFKGGGDEQATAHIDDTVKLEEDGVTETMEISIDLEGENEAVANAVNALKSGGGEGGAQLAECPDGNCPKH